MLGAARYYDGRRRELAERRRALGAVLDHLDTVPVPRETAGELPEANVAPLPNTIYIARDGDLTIDVASGHRIVVYSSFLRRYPGFQQRIQVPPTIRLLVRKTTGPLPLQSDSSRHCAPASSSTSQIH